KSRTQPAPVVRVELNCAPECFGWAEHPERPLHQPAPAATRGPNPSVSRIQLHARRSPASRTPAKPYKVATVSSCIRYRGGSSRTPPPSASTIEKKRPRPIHKDVGLGTMASLAGSTSHGR